jgi:hypothetical protein
VTATLLVAALLAAPAQAQFLPDPVQKKMLEEVKVILKAIEELRLRLQDRLQVRHYNRIRGYAFPVPLWNPIVQRIAPVVSIRRELQRLGCNWRFTPRTADLRRMLDEKLSFCRDSYQGTWGRHDPFWDQPVQEMNDYVGTMTANMISERVDETNRTWVRAHADTFDLYAISKRSPGEANRAEAASLAWAGEVAVGNNQIVTQNLLVREMERALERFDQKKATDWSHYTYRGLSTLGERMWEPHRREEQP